MVIVDSGPVIAALNRSDHFHDVCVAAFDGLDAPALTTWPVVTEAMQILMGKAGWAGSDQVWELITTGALGVVGLDEDVMQRSRQLMSKYRDVPMALADASLVALAESRQTRRIFTLDHDFLIYRYRGRQPFELVPRPF